MPWSEVEKVVPQAKAIAWDSCHKIYILLDDEQVKQMAAYGYDENKECGGSRLFTSKEMSPKEMLRWLHIWYDASCPLRFINSVRTVEGDPNAGFTGLITQFE